MVLLAFMVATGMWNTTVENLIQGGYDYRETVSPWFRGLFLLDPDATVMTASSVPLSYQLHAIGGWLILMVWPFSRLVHAWSVPLGYLRRSPIVYRSRAPRRVRVGAGGLTSNTTATEGHPHVHDCTPTFTPTSNTRALVLALAAFGVSFYAWALLGPLGPDLQKQLGLSDVELLVTIAVPVVLGSLMRIPLGILTDRHGGREVFTALMAFTPIPLIGLALFNDSWGAVLFFGFLLGFAGASFAVGVPFVNRWYAPQRQGFALGIYGMGMGGTVLGAMTAPKIVDATSLDVPFWIAAALMAVMAVVFWTFAEDAPGSASGAHGSWLAPLAVFRGPGASRAWALTLFYFMAFGGFVAMFLFLPKMLTGVHDLSKPDAGYRAAGFAALAVVGRPLGGWLSDRIGAATVLQDLLRRHARARARRSPGPTRRWCRSRSPA